jgi:hypothetical protein
MSESSKTNPSASVDASGLGDSPKPHGDKLASGKQGTAGETRESGQLGGAIPGDSPKPHGDKLASAREGAVRSDGPPKSKE